MKRQLFAAATLAASLMMGQTAAASDCKVDVEDPFDLEAAAISEIYDCIKAEMVEGEGPKDQKIAVVGAGPSGLSCAYHP